MTCTKLSGFPLTRSIIQVPGIACSKYDHHDLALITISNLSQTAAEFGKFEICQYLLDQATWPDQSCLLTSALGLIIRKRVPAGSQPNSAFYRLFMADTGFDGNLYDDFRYRWLWYCPDEDSLDVILQNQFSGFDSISTEYRFEVVSRVRSVSAFGFTKFIGLGLTDKRLALLRNSDGATVLNCVARHLSHLSLPKSKSAGHRGFVNELRAWLRIGINVLQHGADPCNIAKVANPGWASLWRDVTSAGNLTEMEEFYSNTPLMDCLGLDGSLSLHCDRRPIFPGTVSGHECAQLRVWTQMLLDAGLDLESYGFQEAEIWKSPLTARGFDYRRVEQLVYGPSPLDWGVRMSHHQEICAYELKSIPGQFPTSVGLPMKISGILMRGSQKKDPGLASKSSRCPPTWSNSEHR